MALRSLHHYGYHYSHIHIHSSSSSKDSSGGGAASTSSVTSSSHKQQLAALQQRCRDVYRQLRANVMRMVLSEHQRTGHFWEQYDDRTGQGMRGHPFTGWTALIVNIMSEQY